MSTDILSKLPPQAPEMEEAIIANIIRNSDLLLQAQNIISSECFYKKENVVLFETFESMIENDNPIDMVTVTNKLRDNKKLEDAGGAYYIATIYNKYDLAINFVFYCQIIFELFVKREMIKLFSENIIKLYDNNTDISDIYDAVIERLEELFERLTDEQVKHMKYSVDNTLQEIRGYSKGEFMPYIKTGVELIDNHIFLTDKFIMGIAAPRGCGKTRYLIHIIRSLIENNKKNDIAIMWYSMEDSDNKIIRLFAAPYVGLTDNQMQSKNYTMTDDELNKVTRVISKFNDYNIDFVNRQDTMNKISRNFAKFTRKHSDKMCFLIIDNVMLIEDLYNAGYSSQTAAEDKIAASMRRIITKNSSEGIRSSIIFLHHMTKEMESRSNAEEAYRPKLAHMKGSSRFADICNAVILLNNPGMHKDLIKRHLQLPDIKCVNSDGSIKLYKRATILQNLLIAEVAKNRDGEMSDDNKAVERYLTDFGLMKFNVLKTVK